MDERRGIIWDMDGVLADSNPYHWQAWQQTMPHYGLEFSRAQFEATCGMTDADLLPMLYGDRLTPEQILEVGEAKEAAYRALVQGGLEPFSGVKRWLAWFKAHRFPQAVASSAPMENIAATLNGLALWRWFDLVISGARLSASKPDPTIFIRAAAGLGLPPARCLVIEDSTAGVEAARRARMRCLAVTNTRTAADLVGADRVVARLDDLTEAEMNALLG